jgi:hypothetical protein
LQLSSVQPLLSLQFAAVPAQTPAEQVSSLVHALPSSHDAVLSLCTHPVAGLQLSSVHGLPSSQLIPVPPQPPSAQVSFVVHALPSSHGDVLLVFTQPVAGLQVSSVQPLPSSQFGAEPPTHAPSAQASFSVHALLSLQGNELFGYTQPVAGLQLSSVQGLPSMHSIDSPGWHAPWAH